MGPQEFLFLINIPLISDEDGPTVCSLRNTSLSDQSNVQASGRFPDYILFKRGKRICKVIISFDFQHPRN